MSLPVPADGDPQKESPPTEAFRAEYRARRVPVFYSGRLHLALTTAIPLAGIGYCLGALHRVGWLECLTVPVTFIYGNFVECLLHRGPMHHRRPTLPFIYEKHVFVHHRFYPAEAFAYEEPRDFHALLLSPPIVLGFLSFFAVPMGAAGFLLISRNVGYLFAATALAYLLNYEWLHYCYHSPETALALRLPLLSRLRSHHLTHHRLGLMARYNFNITVPIFDWLYGTMHPKEGGAQETTPRPDRGPDTRPA